MKISIDKWYGFQLNFGMVFNRYIHAGYVSTFFSLYNPNPIWKTQAKIPESYLQKYILVFNHKTNKSSPEYDFFLVPASVTTIISWKGGNVLYCLVVLSFYGIKKIMYYKQFYQLMRQTLLGWEMVKRKEYGAEDFIHLHIIPEENKDLKEKITSPGLSGADIEEAWKNTLRKPGKYVVLDPKEFLKPVFVSPDTKSILTYLVKRYWE